MKSQNTTNELTTRSFVRPAIIMLALLSVPFFAMLFDIRVIDPGNPIPERINWGPFDFAVMGILIYGVAFAYEFLQSKVKGMSGRFALAASCAVVFLVVWAELAVGAISRMIGWLVSFI